MNELVNEDTLGAPINSFTNGAGDMSDKATFKTFIEESTSRSPDGIYNLSIWNHGGGIASGICFPDGGDSSLSLADIKDTFEQTAIKDNPLLSLAFDACLMGGIEDAMSLKDYYYVMFGSEETIRGNSGLYTTLKNGYSAYQNSSDLLSVSGVVATQMMQYRSTQAFQGDSADAEVATAAIYEGSQAVSGPTSFESEIAAIGDLASYIKNSNTDVQNAFYRAMKNARIRSQLLGATSNDRTAYDYVDINDFYTHLRTEVNANANLGADTKTALLGKIDTVLSYSNSLAKDAVYNANGETTYYNGYTSAQLGELYKKTNGNDLCGMSIYVPLYNTEETKNDTLNMLKSLFAVDLTDPEDPNIPMQAYIELIENYSAFIYSSVEANRVASLGEEMASNVYNYYEDVLDLSWDETSGKRILTLKINEYKKDEAENIIKPSHSSGDSFVDLAETANQLNLYLTMYAKANFTNNEGSSYEYALNIVIGNYSLNFRHLNGLEETVNTVYNSLSDFTTNAISGQSVVTVEEEQATSYTDYVAETNVAAESALLTLMEASESIAYDSNCQNYKVFLGNAKNSDGVTLDPGTYNTDCIYHVFVKTGDSEQYLYKGTVWEQRAANGSYTYSELSVQSISFYHKYVDNHGIYYLECSNYGTGYSNYAIETSSYYYDVTDVETLPSFSEIQLPSSLKMPAAIQKAGGQRMPEMLQKARIRRNYQALCQLKLLYLRHQRR